MLRLFLRLYFKSKLKRFYSYVCLIIILVFLIGSIENRIDIHPVIYISFISFFVISLFLYLEVKETKICIISDTRLNQKRYKDETGLEASEKRKLKVGYRKWLIRIITENNHDITKTQSFISNIGNYCFYCYISIIPILIITVFSSLFLTSSQMFIITSVVFVSIISLCIIIDRRITNLKYKELDSEIKRILFEEETGYQPLVKSKYTFKYKVWLLSIEEKM